MLNPVLHLSKVYCNICIAAMWTRQYHHEKSALGTPRHCSRVSTLYLQVCIPLNEVFAPLKEVVCSLLPCE